MSNRISAQVICDSISPAGFRMLTYKCVLPRIVLAEMNTHKMLSKNLASSRAIRFTTALKGIMDTPFVPIAFQKDHVGMQGAEYFDETDSERITDRWLQVRDLVAEKAHFLNQGQGMGLTKQLCNRLIESFQYVTAIISGTEWENFIALRASSMAEIHIADLAEKILEAANQSTPRSLLPGEYHLPMGEDIDEHELATTCFEFTSDLFQHVYQDCTQDLRQYPGWEEEARPHLTRLVCAGRLARISYQTLEDVPRKSLAEDIRLAKRLIDSGHWSPMEHIAMCMGPIELRSHAHMYAYEESLINPEEIESGLQVIIMNHADPELAQPQAIISYGWSGNLRGFVQYRKTFPNENRTEPRLEKKHWIDPRS